jgi:hypothetical protein
MARRPGDGGTVRIEKRIAALKSARSTLSRARSSGGNDAGAAPFDSGPLACVVHLKGASWNPRVLGAARASEVKAAPLLVSGPHRRECPAAKSPAGPNNSDP